ncbi:MAG: M48 family metalloprotease [Candidatus Cloacimonadota bacterium]|nr:M48 family metalloprotease [Candidatus Cloacimonadota bacterium]
MKRTLTIILVLFSICLFSQKSAIVQRDRAIVRTGPGSFFQILAELEKGTSFTIIERDNGWLQIQKNELEGYVSKKVTVPRKTSDDIFSRMGRQKTDLRVSQHGMSAGVKGFAQKFTKKFAGAPNFLTLYTSSKLDERAYKNFRMETYREFNHRANYKKFIIPTTEVKDYFSFPEEGMGIGIASRIASLGIYGNLALTEYVNQVGNIVVEATDVYDINYKFFILDIDEVNGYACPGGIVFITLGMLKMIRTEAELACVLAHEIAHVAQHHGMLEMEERKHHIMSDNAFGEMEEEMDSMGIVQDKEFLSVEAEMEELCFNIYETIVNGRLQAYEKEADELAILYASRAGYNGRHMLNLLQRLKHSSTITNNEHYTQEQIEERIDRVSENLSLLPLDRNLFDHKDRWNRRSGF